MVVGVGLAVALAGARPAHADQWEDAGWGALSVGANLGYMPAKLVYATFGAMTGGLAYGLTLGNSQVADTIWGTSMGGTYVLTPRMLQGQDEIAFAGRPFDDPWAATGETPVQDGQQLGAGPSPGLREQALGGS
jgi:hypothetical protein